MHEGSHMSWFLCCPAHVLTFQPNGIGGSVAEWILSTAVVTVAGTATAVGLRLRAERPHPFLGASLYNLRPGLPDGGSGAMSSAPPKTAMKPVLSGNATALPLPHLEVSTDRMSPVPQTSSRSSCDTSSADTI